MAEQRAQRRLAAILAADVVGYSRLMRADEAGTLAQLKSIRSELIDPKIAEYGGRIVKTTGDGILIEFPSAVDAVQHAIDVQTSMHPRNADLPQDRRMEIRIGINVGDVVVEREDLFGDGVNVAARLEGLAEPGGICISGNAYEQVRDKLQTKFEDLGEQHVKNIDRPVQAYRVSLDNREPAKTTDVQSDTASPPLTDKPSIAVLPFNNMSNDAEQEYFADGISEDLITDLSKLEGLTVIARNSSFAFKGRQVGVKEAAQTLGVRNILEGSVRKMGNRGLVGGEGFAVDASVIEADASRFARIEGSEIDWSDAQRARRPIAEYLTALDGESAPINPARAPKALSPTDPTAAWTTRGRHKVMFGYSVNYLIDLEHAVIVDVEATPTRISKEVDATQTMIDRVAERFALKPDRIAGDVAYGTGEMLGWLVDHDIDPHIPVWDRTQRDDGTFSREDFTYDSERDVYICPDGKTLPTTGRVVSGNTLYYRARKHDCQDCPLKDRCCPTSPQRRLSRDVNEPARDHTRALMETDAYAVSSGERKKIERLFGEAKTNLSLTRLRLRGLAGARDEFLLTAIVQNLKRLAATVARPPPRLMNA